MYIHIYIYIYIYTNICICIHMSHASRLPLDGRPVSELTFRHGGFYFVCDHGKHRNAKLYNFWCNLLLGGETKVTPKIVLFSKKHLAT